jgi:hypothetical protein
VWRKNGTHDRRFGGLPAHHEQKGAPEVELYEKGEAELLLELNAERWGIFFS